MGRWALEMVNLEGLLVSGCTEMPACRCGHEMVIQRTCSVPQRADTHIRVYTCPACEHEMRLTVWGSEEIPGAIAADRNPL